MFQCPSVRAGKLGRPYWNSSADDSYGNVWQETTTIPLEVLFPSFSRAPSLLGGTNGVPKCSSFPKGTMCCLSTRTGRIGGSFEARERRGRWHMLFWLCHSVPDHVQPWNNLVEMATHMLLGSLVFSVHLEQNNRGGRQEEETRSYADPMFQFLSMAIIVVKKWMSTTKTTF